MTDVFTPTIIPLEDILEECETPDEYQHAISDIHGQLTHLASLIDCGIEGPRCDWVPGGCLKHERRWRSWWERNYGRS